MSAAERPLMNVDEAIRLRRSVRGFLPREVPEAILREVFMLAQCAPSNCNVQPWNPHVVSGEKLRQLRGNHKLLCGISFGYEDHGVRANAARVDRAPIDDVVRFHR